MLYAVGTAIKISLASDDTINALCNRKQRLSPGKDWNNRNAKCTKS